jgi:hypothetical protein
MINELTYSTHACTALYVIHQMSKLFEARFAAMTVKMDAAMRIKEGIVSSSDDVDTDTQDNSDDDSTTTTAAAKRGKGKATAKRAIIAVDDDSTTDSNNNNANADANSDKTATKGKQAAVKKARHNDSNTIELVDNANSSDGTDADDDEPMFEPDVTEGNHTYCTCICYNTNRCTVRCRS